MTLRISFLIISLSLFGCDATSKLLNKDKEKGESKASSDKTGGDPNGGGGQDDDYQPGVDDKVTLKQKSKGWKSPSEEPAEWDNDIELYQEVIATYAKNLPCKVRIRYEPTSGDPYEADYGCPVYQCGPDPVEECREEKLNDETIGDFKNAKGRKVICRTLTETLLGGGQKSRALTYTETSTWTHPDALRTGHVVKSQTYSCSVGLPKGETGAGLDPCKFVQGRVVTYARSEESILSQEKGKGATNEISSIPTFYYKPAGAVTEPSTGDRIKQAEPECTMSGESGPINVVLAKQICDDKNGYQAMTLTIPGLTSEGGTELAVPTAGFSFQYKDKTYAAQDAAACKADLDVDLASRSLIGAIRCGDRTFKDSASNDTVSVDRIDFKCPIKDPSSSNGGQTGDNGNNGTGNTGDQTGMNGSGEGVVDMSRPTKSAQCSDYFSIPLNQNVSGSQSGYGSISCSPYVTNQSIQCTINATVNTDSLVIRLDASSSATLQGAGGMTSFTGQFGYCTIDCTKSPNCLVRFQQ